MKGLYYKPEPEKRPWTYIPSKKAALEKAIAAGAMFTTWQHFEYEPVNDTEPKRYGSLVLDFDDKEHPEFALTDMLELCLKFLPDQYGVDPQAIEYFASGSKGFHAVLPSCLFGHPEGHEKLPLIYKRIAQQWRDELDMQTLDMSLYCMGKGKMFRLPNIKRSCGTYKVPLSLDELYQLDADDLLELSKEPRTIKRQNLDMQPCDALKALYEQAQQAVEAYPDNFQEPLTKEQIEQISQTPPPCIRYIIEHLPAKSESFNFNRAVTLLVNYFQDIGVDRKRALESCAPFIQNYNDSDSYDTPEKRLEHFDKIWKYMIHQFGYHYNCERAKGLRMPPEAYGCLKCIQSTPEIASADTVNDNTVSEKPIGEDSLDFPAYVMEGFAGHFAEKFSAVMETPKHFLFMGYLTCLGAYFSPFLTVDSELKTQPRLFTVLVGESAIERKSTALSKVINVYNQAFPDFKACWGIGSAEGLQRVLKKKESAALILDRVGVCLVFDEFKSFVSKCQIETSVLLPIVNTLFEQTMYETHTKNKSVVINDACLSLLAATTKDTYERIYTNAFITIGFPNRVFLVPGHAERRFSIPQKVSETDRIKVHSDLIELRNFVGSGLEFSFSDRARKIYHQWYLGAEQSVHSKRLDTYSLRLMQLLALNLKQTVIDTHVTEQAIALCDWQLDVRKLFDPIDADSGIAAMEQKIMRLVKKGSTTDRDLKIKTNAYRSGLWFYDTALTNLKKADEIAFDKKTGTWRPK